MTETLNVDLKAWLALHGQDINDVHEVKITRHPHEQHAVMLRVERMAYDSDGKWFVDRDTRKQAIETVWVPLVAWPAAP